MSQAQSTVNSNTSQGSTRPSLLTDQYVKEAEEIRKRWSTQDSDSAHVRFGSNCLHRHKSLILDLALEDYVRDRKTAEDNLQLSSYCKQYSWLGNALEDSIYRLLEVQEFLYKHPDAFPSQELFDWPCAGTTFLDFLVIEEIGRGATGRVYLCEQLRLGGRQVVLKIESGPNAHEALLLGKLAHPNITPLYWADYDAELDFSFICMPFLGRSTLLDLIRDGFQDGLPTSCSVVEKAAQCWLKESDPLCFLQEQGVHTTITNSSYVTRILSLAHELADALAFVHGREIVHGDIKPSNVLLSPHGRPYLLDFNLGHANDGSSKRYGGTPLYMSPEQLAYIRNPSEYVKPPKIDFASDIYSFGVLLYELLAGMPPYVPVSKKGSAESLAEEMVALQEQGYQPICKINPSVDGILADLIYSCLSADPSVRPASMSHLRDQLQHLNSLRQRGRRLLRRRPLTVSVFALLFIVSITAATLSVLSSQPLQDQLLDRALQARAELRIADSTELLTEVMLQDPGNDSARLLRARGFNELEQYSLAAADLHQLSMKSQDAPTKAFQAYNMHFLGQHDTAALMYRTALDRGFKNSAVLNNLAFEYFLTTKPKSNQERMALISPLIDEALKLDPDSPQIRMTAFTYYRRHHQRFETEMRAAAKEHIDWLKENLSTNANVCKAIQSYYVTLARHGLVDSSIVQDAYRLLEAASDLSSLPRVLDPLKCDH